VAEAPAVPAVPAAASPAKPTDPDRIGPPAIEGATNVPTPRTFTQPAAPGRKQNFAPFIPPPDYSPPVIYIEESKFDFGKVIKGEVVQHRYKYKNNGKAPLVIQKIRPGCGCTVIDNWDKVVAPGAEGTFEAKLETSRLAVGPINKYADVISNDPKQSSLRCTIAGTIEALLKIEPESPRITSVRGQGQGKLQMTLSRNLQQEMKVTGAKSQSGRLVVGFSETQPGTMWKIDLTTNYNAKETQNYFSEVVQLEVMMGERKLTQEVTVAVQLKDRIEMTPRIVYFRKNDFQPLKDKGAPATKTVEVKANLEPPYKFTIKEAKFDAPDSPFKVKIEPVVGKEDREYRLVVLIDKMPDFANDPNQKSLKGNLTVVTDDPDMPEISIRCVAFF
jgi:hypothetical protein